MNPDKLSKLAAQVRTGGKGSVRRKKKVPHKSSSTDDKKLQATLKRLGCNQIPGIEEVNFFNDDDTVTHFKNVKVTGNPQANTYVIAGTAEKKKLQDLLPGIISQLGQENLRKLAESFAQGKGGDAGKDDDVPDLVENFEEASKQ
eukprot:TRINITY_DN13787_c0_g1_i1.p1 TRINITY_DN13787_c0_g1~~TRINITY_DN13787_c0_g1_i1.p1  ORF type:complete len:166 (+),score=52.37 TRINITY_DN13787_c0_g1_i1:64-498(+)